jgi:RNase P protein component
MREAVRLRAAGLPAGWDVVFNPRRAVGDAAFDRLTGEVDRLFALLRSQA